MSLLLDHGHADAMLYPLGMVADEVELAVDRENRRIATLGVVVHQAVGATTAPKDMGPIFTKLIRGLNGE